MPLKNRWAGIVGAAALMLAATPAAFAANASDCPNGGVVRFGVEPYDTSAKLVPIYDHIGKALSDQIGCQEQQDRSRQQRRDIHWISRIHTPKRAG